MTDVRLFLQECKPSHQSDEQCATLFVRWIFDEQEREPICRLFRGESSVIASMNPVRTSEITLCTHDGCFEPRFTPKENWEVTLDELSKGILFRAENIQSLSPLKEYVQRTLPRQIRQKVSFRKDFWLRAGRTA